MIWEKKDLIYSPPFDGSWRHNSALTPTPFLLNKDVIRIYASFRDTSGVGRIGYVDVEANNPSSILKISQTPVLDIGKDGMFDDNGVILGDVIRVGEDIYMYYVGFQLVKKAKFLAYTGLAISTNHGESFKRVFDTPILDRKQNGKLFNAIHTVIYDNGKFKAWCGVGSDWLNIEGVNYPSYNVQYYESNDGVNFDTHTCKVCIHLIADEYRIGRPRVFIDDNLYKMIYTFGTTSGKYEMGYAESIDGIVWSRKDSMVGIKLSESGWDSQSISYGVPLKYKNKIYMLYNGNEMGKNGFGYAELIEV